ncbi:hypothetical protein TMM008_62210 [Pseudomonas sp. 008]|nr:hypothetical protein TMM008_62210 [Pseudomonas sp. 008]
MGGLVLQQGEGREESSDHAGGGKTMGAPCFEPGDVYGGYHGGVLQKMKQASYHPAIEGVGKPDRVAGIDRIFGDKVHHL